MRIRSSLCVRQRCARRVYGNAIALLGSGCLALACDASARQRELPYAALPSPAGTFTGVTGGSSADPALGSDPETGEVVMSWLAADDSVWSLWVSGSSDAGATWSEPVRVFGPNSELKPHPEAAPRLIVADGGRRAIAWASTSHVAGREWPASAMRFSRTTDGGRTWSPPVTLNDDTAAGPGGHTFHGAAREGADGIVVAWLDERAAAASSPAHHGDAKDEEDATVYLARSSDFGATWSASNELLWGATCPCCRIVLARNPDGAVSAAWRKHLPGSVRDIVYAPLSAAPAEPARVHEDDWVYPGCPHTGPALDIDGAGTAHVTWYSGREGNAGLFYTRGTDPFADPIRLAGGEVYPTVHPGMAAVPGGAVVAWDADADGLRRLSLASVTADARTVATTEVEGSDGAGHPQIAALRDGSALVAFTVTTGNTSEVRLLKLEPGGT